MVMRRFAVSDLHGQLELFNQIKEYINEDDVVYALGDFGDRGPEPWRTLKAVIDDPQFIYIMGNHDLLLVEAIEEILRYSADHAEWDWDFNLLPLINTPCVNDLTKNGGWDTLMQWAQESDRATYFQKLRNLPVEITLSIPGTNNLIYLSHAGYNPNSSPYLLDGYLWDRSHFYYKSQSTGNIVVYGHSPIPLLKDWLGKNNYFIKDDYLVHDDGNKICIDCGAHFTDKTVLLDLDTLEGKTFRVTKDEFKLKR